MVVVVGKAAQGAPSPQAPAVSQNVAEAGKSDSSPDWWWIVISLILALIGVWWGTSMRGTSDVTFTVSAGVGEFALFYIVAQAFERMGEFLSHVPFVGRRLDRKQTKPALTQARDNARVACVAKLASGQDAQTELKQVADAQNNLQIVRANRAIFFLGLNTALAASACGYFNLDLLREVGVTGAAPWLSIGITALAVGGGTKPLHDFIKNLQKAKDEKLDSPTHVG